MSGTPPGATPMKLAEGVSGFVVTTECSRERYRIEKTFLIDSHPPGADVRIDASFADRDGTPRRRRFSVTVR
jgi:hypothetical protein